MAADLVDMALGQEYGNPGLPKTSTLNLGKGATLKLTLIPAGKFMMGSKLSAEEVAKRFYSTNMDYLYKAEHPQHQVMISKPFYMGVTEVTRGQFAVFVADSGYKTTAEKEGWSYAYDLMTWGKVTGISWRKTGFKQTDSHPVVCVSWDDAAAFCSWLKAKIGRNVSLPTEAQWEYACRADTKTIYSFGDKAEKRNKHANYCEKSCEFDLSWKDKSHDDGYGFTAPVGSYKPNAWGLYDMHGNVYEWCRDWYDKSFYSRAKNVDPENTTRARYRVIRGGSWFSFAQFCRAASRLRSFSDRRDYSGGFRVVVESGSAVK
jgi:formylglycine-generating enzyme required for sulfatase activity